MTTGAEALARAICDTEAVRNGSTLRYSNFDDEGRAMFQAEAEPLLAALSPADRLAIAGITEERLAAALHEAKVDCNPLARTGGPFGVSIAHHNRASLHDDSARAILAALQEQTP